ncbi:hypothetical protein GI482_00350 [Bacillus sp. N3536]|nr:hypothetical protein GI482_00350 [Bacillus sp. N3536]
MNMKFIKLLLLFVLAIGLTFPSSTKAATPKVMWGKTELKLGQIGKVTVNSRTVLYKLEKDNSLTVVRDLQKGDEFRVYSYKSMEGGLYGVGNSNFIYKSPVVKYETPSKTKLALLNGNPYVNPVQIPKPGAQKDKNAVYKEKLNTIKNTKYNDYKGYANAIFKLQQEVGRDNYEMFPLVTEAYYHYGIEVDEAVISFSDGSRLLAFKREPQMYSYPTNRSAMIYNNEYYLSVPFIEYVLNASMDTYFYQDEPSSKGYNGKFWISGSSNQISTIFKDESNKKAGYYNVSTLTDFIKNRALTISEKEHSFISGGVGHVGSSVINPYSNSEIQQILDIKFETTYDKANNRMTFHFDKPMKEKYPN